MSVIIKGIDMPGCCNECPCRAVALSMCMVTRRSTSHTASGKPLNERQRPGWCPLEEFTEVSDGSN